MKTVFTFFGCILFASIVVSLQAFIVENRTQNEIEIFTLTCDNLMTCIKPESVVINGALVGDNNSHCIKLQPRDMAEVVMGQNIICNIRIYYKETDFTGILKMVHQDCHRVLNKDSFICFEKIGVKERRVLDKDIIDWILC